MLELLFKEYEQNEGNELLYYDIIDFAQHYTAYKADRHLLKAIEYYNASEYDKGDLEFKATKDLLMKLEFLQVATEGSFTKWCEDAVALATTDEEQALYLKNAKTQVTIWGGDRLKDYASKSWSGILSEFYIPRWQMLFDARKEQRDRFDLKTTQKSIQKWEENWADGTSIPASPDPLTEKQYLELVKEIIGESF